MIGARRTHQGQGLARILFDRLHTMSDEAPDSCGVSLSTELPANVPLYQHVGYDVIGHVRVNDVIETWGFFRPDVRDQR
jgi:hypothetical protein